MPARQGGPSAENQSDNVQLLAAGVVVALLGLVFVIASIVRYQRVSAEVARGPRKITEAQLLELGDKATPPSGYMVFETSEVTQTNLVVKHGKSKSAPTTSRYILVKVGNRWAVANVPNDFTGKRLVGYVSRLDEGSDLARLARNEVANKSPRQTLAPLFFQVHILTRDSQVSWIVASGGMLVVGIVICVVWFLQTRRPPKRSARKLSTQPEPSWEDF
jgi:hypothetical protein